MIEFVAIPEERMKFLRRDKSWLKQLKKFYDVKIDLNEEIAIEGEDALTVLRVKEVMKAFGRGFEFEDALNLIDEEYALDTIELTQFAGKSRNRQITLKGRVIGTKGKTKKMIEKYTDVKIAVYGKTISIIGKWQNIRIAREAIEMLLCGSIHNTVYQFLERGRR